MRMDPQKTKAREFAIFAIPMTVSGLVMYVMPAHDIALAWMVVGATMLARAAYLWWGPKAEGS